MLFLSSYTKYKINNKVSIIAFVMGIWLFVISMVENQVVGCNVVFLLFIIVVHVNCKGFGIYKVKCAMCGGVMVPKPNPKQKQKPKASQSLAPSATSRSPAAAAWCS